MQLYAFDHDQQLVSANQAQKQVDYFCLECQAKVRVRGGIHRQKHFYHMSPNQHCSLQGKSIEHLQVQCYIQNLFPDGECQLECRFPEIGRIADVVWAKEKLIFEVQCSPIYAQEVQGRIENYQSLGYQVVWVLHDQTFNQFRASAAEHFLQDHTHYFTNIDKDGIGEIYDQFSILHKGFRKHVLDSLSVNLAHPKLQKDIELDVAEPPAVLMRRVQTWQVYFKGDLISLALKTGPSYRAIYLEKAVQREATIHFKAPKTTLMDWLYWLVVRPYHLIFQILLEKACR